VSSSDLSPDSPSPAAKPAKPAKRTPRETVELLLRMTVEGTRDQMADLYAPDVHVEMPFTPAGFPSETRGSATIRARMKAVESLWTFDSVDGVVLHETADPQVVVAEFRVHGRLSATSDEFSLGFVNVIRVVDGLIVSSRDYGNPLESQKLAAALSGPLESAQPSAS
jgi:ketosteroid isomerase-like protein